LDQAAAAAQQQSSDSSVILPSDVSPALQTLIELYGVIANEMDLYMMQRFLQTADARNTRKKA